VRLVSIKSCMIMAACVAVAGCDADEVRHFRVAKAPPSGPAGATALASAAAAAPEPAKAAGRSLRWTLPKGWAESEGGAMRVATLKPPVAGKIDASVVVLPGPAGGELANVNRWRGQIGLPALDEAGLAAARKVIQTKVGPLKVYDFTSEATPRSRVVAGLTESAGNTWFVKLSGDADAVGAARGDFMKLLGSLRFE